MYTVADLERALTNDLLVPIWVFDGRDCRVVDFEDRVIAAFRAATGTQAADRPSPEAAPAVAGAPHQAPRHISDMAWADAAPDAAPPVDPAAFTMTPLSALGSGQRRISLRAYRDLRRWYPGLPEPDVRQGWLVTVVVVGLSALVIQALMLAPWLMLGTALMSGLVMTWIGLRGRRVPPFYDRIDRVQMQLATRWSAYAKDQTIRYLVRKRIQEVAVVFRAIDPDEAILSGCGLKSGGVRPASTSQALTPVRIAAQHQQTVQSG